MKAHVCVHSVVIISLHALCFLALLFKILVKQRLLEHCKKVNEGIFLLKVLFILHIELKISIEHLK